MPVIPEGRLLEIERRILDAEAPSDFVPKLATEWKRSKRQVWKYVAKVRARLAERARAVDPDADRELVRSLLLDAFRTAKKGGELGADTRGMVAAAKTLGELTGAITKNVKVDASVGGLGELMALAFGETKPGGSGPPPPR